MDDLDSAVSAAVLAELARRGIATSGQLQAALGKSQPTLSRALRELGSQVAVLGRQRSARYALPRGIAGLPAHQPISWTGPDGLAQEWGWLTHLAGERVHVQAPGLDVLTQGRLPWFLAPWKLQGFLGRLWARSPAAAGFDSNPERWRVDQLLTVLLQQVHDLPGAIGLGPISAPPLVGASLDPAQRQAHFDSLADSMASTLPAGSSAGGEQAKFITADADGQRHLIVKFTPPRGTPFGERWHDLLHAEALALHTLAAHGVPVASARVIESPRRSYLESTRFDRVGRAGRRHVVPLDAVHDAFVPGPRHHWAASCELLARRRRLPAEAATQARALMQFGRLIGNSDMHFGNFSLLVDSPDDVARGRFALAPVYDMLPMRWRPDPLSGGVFDWLPFEPELQDLASPARPIAGEFWQRVEAHTAIGLGLRRLAATMASRVG